MTADFPPPLRPGDRVGVAAVSGPVGATRLAAGLAALERLGYRPVPARNLRDRDAHGLFAGDDDARLEELHRLAADPDVRAVVFARGGHGFLRLLPRLDWSLLGRHPRAWVGYSDLTPFLLEVPRRLGLVAFHGPMVAADLARGLTAAEESSFHAALAGRGDLAFDVARGAGEAVEGTLLGGCLSLLAATLGTPWSPRLDGAVVFLEEVGEPLYRVDRMLTHLRLSGTLTGIHAMIAGHLTEITTPHETPAVTLLDSLASALGVPFASGLAAGHESPNLTLPIGARVRLDPAAGRLEALRP